MKAREMTGKLQDWQKRATASAKTFGQTSDQYVRENTWTAIAVAVVLGCVLGYVLANRED